MTPEERRDERLVAREAESPVHQMRCVTEQSYDVRLVDDVLAPESGALARLLAGRRALIVTTPTVFAFHEEALTRMIQEASLDASVLVLSCSEDRKTLTEVETLCREAMARSLDRRSLLVGFGGGVCMDIVSVAASAIRRGIGCVRVPTTLIGQIDAGIGLKGAINLQGKKSYFGCFHAPERVVVDPKLLSTLPVPYLQFGFAEIIKMALVRDLELFELVEAHHERLLKTHWAEPAEEGRRILWLAIKRMLEELEKNPYEDRGYQRLVDLGHTFSPALEAVSSFSIHHGVAVGIDTALTVTLAEELGLLSSAHRERVVGLLRAVGLPTYSPLLTEERCEESLHESMLHRGGAINLPVPVAIGTASFLERREQLPRAVLARALERLMRESGLQATVAA